MSNVKIYYHQYVGDILNDYSNPFDIDGIGFDPILAIKQTPKEKSYYSCPAWHHKSIRTYNIFSPVDIELELTSNFNIVSKTLSNDKLNFYVESNSIDNTIQLNIPRFLFWSNKKNLWIESKPHPLTSSKNNLVSMGAWWNLSSWVRPISFAFDVVDPNKPVIIKRGDPILQVCFYTKNLNDTFELVKTYPPDKILKDTRKRSLIKAFLPNCSHQFIFKEQESKCPFSFLFNKKVSE